MRTKAGELCLIQCENRRWCTSTLPVGVRVPNIYMTDDIFDGDGERPPKPSRATRRMAKRSKASSRGGVVVHLPTWDRPRIVHFESKLEQRVLFLLLATGDIVDIWEQPPCVNYLSEAGRRKHHFFDFLVRMGCGERVAIAVKPLKVAKRTRFVSELRLIREAVNKDFADQVRLITDADFTRSEALNAERYYDFKRHAEIGWRHKLEAALENVPLPMEIGELVCRLGNGVVGYRTIFIAIYEGVLAADKTVKINHQTLVSRGHVKLTLR